MNEAETRTVAYNWRTGTRRLINRHYVSSLSGLEAYQADGFLYGGSEDQAWRFRLDSSEEQRLAHLPTHVSAHDRRYLYSLEFDRALNDSSYRLWVSTDEGLTWEQRRRGRSSRTGLSLACR